MRSLKDSAAAFIAHLPHIVAALVTLLTVGIWVVGVLAAAIVLFPGLTPAKALGAAGLLSVAIGLAFKDIFETSSPEFSSSGNFPSSPATTSNAARSKVR